MTADVILHKWKDKNTDTYKTYDNCHISKSHFFHFKANSCQLM